LERSHKCLLSQGIIGIGACSLPLMTSPITLQGILDPAL
jgi:hypothetical protein